MNIKLFIVTVLCILLGALNIPALDVPPAKGYVTDYAGLLTPAEISRLDKALREYDTRTSNQVLVLIIKSLKGEAIESFGIKVAEKWKPGQKGKDNGAIFIIAKEDRQTKIEVGYGLEHLLTDLECSLIIDKIVKPKFQDGKYSEGIAAAIDSIINAITGDIMPQAGNVGNQSAAIEETGAWIFILLFFGFFIGIALISRAGRRGGLGGSWSAGGFGRTGWGGGGFGSSGRGGFSGGGGRFGGGGASGRW
jgi:uncharacterized protein